MNTQPIPLTESPPEQPTTTKIPIQQSNLSQPPLASPRLRWRRREPSTVLVFSPLAWLKLMFYLHAGDTEVGGFAVTSPSDPLYVQEFVTIRQVTTSVSVEFADDAVADYFDRCVDLGLRPEHFARIWLHTHPGSSPEPSYTDEETFQRVFGACDWAVMFIVSRTGQTYARLSFGSGPRGEVMLNVAVDWSAWPELVLEQDTSFPQWLRQWTNEFERNVHPALHMRMAGGPSLEAQGYWNFEEYDARQEAVIEAELEADARREAEIEQARHAHAPLNVAGAGEVRT